ncbi:MAG: DUF1018 domain-containing protein [Tenuifilaceae bacterium]|nr:DUF1018 domain-containing protein [Tenuifilaceae bacterium]
MKKEMKKDTKKTVPQRRRTLLHIAHKAATQLGWDEETRRDIQKTHTGHASCRDMSDTELAEWCWMLKDMGADIYVPNPAPRGGQDLTKPTTQQLAQIERLAFERGWKDGLDDGRLRGFVKHTAGVEDVRFASRKQATNIISGMRRWKQQGESAA